MKYEYLGMSIEKYCQKNNLSSRTIYRRIDRLKKKYPHLTPDELVTLAFDNKKLNKYEYLGMSIKEYCERKNITPQQVYNRVGFLKKQNPALTPQELFELAITKKWGPKYEYHGMSIKEYCEKNNLSVRAIYFRIHYVKKKNPNLSPDEIITKAIEEKRYQIYNFEGLSMREYCKLHGIPLTTMYERISTLKKSHPNLSDEELVKLAVLNKHSMKYEYHGMSIPEYCETHSIPKSYIYHNISSLKKQNPNLTPEELVNTAFEKYYTYGINSPKTHYYYLGVSLREFCNNNDLSYNSIKAYLLAASKNPKYEGLTDEELVSYFVEQKYPINGLTLKEYCSLVNFSYESMHELLKEKLKQYPNIKFKIILTSVINSINELLIKETQNKNNNVNNLTLTR